MSKKEEIISATKAALKDLNLKNSFDNEFSRFLLTIKFRNLIYKMNILCTDQYICAITIIPTKKEGDRINDLLAEINDKIGVGYYHKSSDGTISSRVSVGLKDSPATTSLIKECILRSLQLANTRFDEITAL